jgi:hypothetical protein
MKKKYDFILYSILGKIIFCALWSFSEIPGDSFFLIQGLIGAVVLFLIILINEFRKKKVILLNVFSYIIFILITIVIFVKYFYWSFFDYFSIIIVFLFLVLFSILIVKRIKNPEHFKSRIELKTMITFFVYLILIIPTFFDIKNGPNMLVHPSIYNPFYGIKKIQTTIDYQFKYPETRELSIKASNCYDNKQMSESIKYYKKAISIEPQNPFLHFDLSQVYCSLNEIELELAELDTTIMFNPHFFEAFNNRGFINYKLGNFNQAISDFNISIGIDSLSPKVSSVYLNKALALFALKRNEEGCIYIQKAKIRNEEFNDDYIENALEDLEKSKCK